MRRSTIADVGTGSGIIGICLARHAPRARVTAIDVSPAALDVARDNAARPGRGRPRWSSSKAICWPRSPPSRQFDFIVSNPPYVSRGEFARAAPEVRQHEPELALIGGDRGTDDHRAAAAPGGRAAAARRIALVGNQPDVTTTSRGADRRRSDASCRGRHDQGHGRPRARSYKLGAVRRDEGIDGSRDWSDNGLSSHHRRCFACRHGHGQRIKNAALPIMAASILADGPVPARACQTWSTSTRCSLLGHLGVEVKRDLRRRRCIWRRRPDAGPGRVRAGPPHARQLLRAGTAGGTAGQGGRFAARRMQHRQPPGRLAPGRRWPPWAPTFASSTATSSPRPGGCGGRPSICAGRMGPPSPAPPT